MTLSANTESSALRLFPNLTCEKASVDLFLERAQENLIRCKPVILSKFLNDVGKVLSALDLS